MSVQPKSSERRQPLLETTTVIVAIVGLVTAIVKLITAIVEIKKEQKNNRQLLRRNGYFSLK